MLPKNIGCFQPYRCVYVALCLWLYFSRENCCGDSQSITFNELMSAFKGYRSGLAPMNTLPQRFCQTTVLGLGLGVDFTFALDNNNNNNKQAGAELCQAQHSLS